ncbi:trp operon repressor [Patescibacteria group bacterium]|nr:trp operon repressor [Patescibacteria group bacterium]MBU1123791.1 trp operon repressor [Patescibacteria group bacterium]MBU1911090.1 trp operon repressor [Patescibacteria group bacterium]
MSKRSFTEGSWKKDPQFRALCSALASCKGPEEVADLLRDLGTLSELKAWSERLEVAKMLAKGMSYREISEKTGASTTTVTRVARFIENGLGGYRRYLKTAPQHQHNSPHGGEKTASVLQGYLDKAQK